MEFEWDEAKRKTVIDEHGVDLLYASQIFEVRLISLGLVGEECFIVVHTEREGATRLITAWKGGRDERSYYEAGIARRGSKNEGGR